MPGPTEMFIALGGMTFTYFLITKILSYSKWERQAKIDLRLAELNLKANHNADADLSMTELKTLIQEAVQQGIAPVEARLTQLEQQKTEKAPLTDVLLSEDPLMSPTKSVGRKEMA